MRHEPTAPPESPLALKDCWDEFENLLRIIETLFGDLFDAPKVILRSAARRVEAWLRDGEAVARALLLSMAATMEVASTPKRPGPSRTKQRSKAQWRFGFAARLPHNRRRLVRYALSPEQMQRLEEARREQRYQRRMFGSDPKPQCETPIAKTRGAPLTLLPHRPPASPFVDRAGVVRRYNGLIQVMRDREKFAARLARRLARNREEAIDRAVRRRAQRPGERPSPYDWLVVAAQAHAPLQRIDSS